MHLGPLQRRRRKAADCQTVWVPHDEDAFKVCAHILIPQALQQLDETVSLELIGDDGTIPTLCSSNGTTLLPQNMGVPAIGSFHSGSASNAILDTTRSTSMYEEKERVLC